MRKSRCEACSISHTSGAPGFGLGFVLYNYRLFMTITHRRCSAKRKRRQRRAGIQRTAATAQGASGGSAGLASGGCGPAGRACAEAQWRDCYRGFRAGWSRLREGAAARLLWNGGPARACIPYYYFTHRRLPYGQYRRRVGFQRGLVAPARLLFTHSKEHGHEDHGLRDAL